MKTIKHFIKDEILEETKIFWTFLWFSDTRWLRNLSFDRSVKSSQSGLISNSPFNIAGLNILYISCFTVNCVNWLPCNSEVAIETS